MAPSTVRLPFTPVNPQASLVAIRPPVHVRSEPQAATAILHLRPESVIHVVKISENELRKQQVGGFYRDVDLGPPGITTNNELKNKERELEGTKKTGKAEPVYNLLECHVNLDLEGFEEVGEDGEPTGIKLPYIVTVEEGSRVVLSIRRTPPTPDLSV